MAAIVCGRKHNGLLVRRTASASSLTRFFDEEAFLWSREAMDGWFARHGLRAVDDRRSWLFRRDGAVRLDQYFGARELPRRAIDFLVADRITLLTYVEDPYLPREAPPCWSVDAPNLGEIQFYRVMDAYGLFQEIEMWVGGVLASSGNPMAEIADDRVRIAKRGFDERSFRKQKPVA